jgi:hypothetical protein
MGKNDYLKSYFIIISLIVLLTKINPYIILPLDYLPDQNYKFIEGDTNIQTKSKEEFMKQLYFKKLITKFEIGTPSKTQTFLLDSDSNDYYLDSLNPPENTQGQCKLSEFYKFEKNEYYNESSSTSYVQDECKTEKHDLYLYDEICYSKDKVTFNINGKTTNIEFPIKVIKNHDESVSGIIGIAINNTVSGGLKSFLSELKFKNLINDYFWFFDFDKFSPFEKKIKGKFVIGDLPHNIFPEKYDKENYRQTAAYRSSSFWTLQMSNAYIVNKTEEYHFSNTDITLFYEFYHAIGTREFLESIKGEFLQKLIDEKKCFSGTFSQNLYSDSDLIFYYCDKSVRDILYENLPGINFESKQLKYTFKLTKEELFYIKDDYIYFMVLFMKSYYNNWLIGQILTSKYHFVFNTDQRQIGFYEQVNMVDDNLANVSSNNIWIYLTFTALLFTIIGITIGIVIGIKYCGKKQRKKRANELLDNNEYNNNDNIN